ncbi:hypothetical protein ACFR9U_08820 [Halorientalis brevis]|uniref:Uncharacterized protein n=1 Tax=Halorientalis brevis TaxID=1126241 RepID=A0ABD6CBJ8_9EURY|nr:hypothetical protein [Halorientalis brevis]
MIRLKRLSFVLILSAALLTVGTGGFSATSIDRSTDISVVEDERAFLGLEAHGRELPYGTTSEETTHSDVRLLTIENQFESDITSLTVTDASHGTPHVIGSIETPNRLEVGSSTTISAAVVCSASGDGTVDLYIKASTGSTTVEKTKSVSVTCSLQQTPANASEN